MYNVVKQKEILKHHTETQIKSIIEEHADLKTVVLTKAIASANGNVKITFDAHNDNVFKDVKCVSHVSIKVKDQILQKLDISSTVYGKLSRTLYKTVPPHIHKECTVQVSGVSFGLFGDMSLDIKHEFVR